MAHEAMTLLCQIPLRVEKQMLFVV